jgi:histidine ammonia-lyase
MAMGAAWKLRRVVDNVQHVIAVELMCAAQGVEYRRPLRAARSVEDAISVVRELVSPLAQDRVLSPDITALAAAVAVGRFTEVAMTTA